jgi:hypothetical protein
MNGFRLENWGENEFSPQAPLIFSFCEFGFGPQGQGAVLDGERVFESKRTRGLNPQSPRVLDPRLNRPGTGAAAGAPKNARKEKNGGLGEIHFPQFLTDRTGMPL